MRLKPEILLVVGWIVAIAILQIRDADDALFTAREVAEAQDRKSFRPEQIFPLTHPLDCDATMQVSVADRVERRGCYVKSKERNDKQ